MATSHGSALYHDMLATVEQGKLPVVIPVAPDVVYFQSFTLTEPCVILEDSPERDAALVVVVAYVHQEVRKRGG